MPASVHKAALVLDLFSVERPDWGPTEVADELGIAKSTAHALLGELTSVGLTERLPCGRYRLGLANVGTRADETGHERIRRGNHADGAPAGEPLRRDGPHHGMGARPRALRRQSTSAWRCGRTGGACCRAPDAAGHGAARGTGCRHRQWPGARRARAHAPTRLRGRGLSAPSKGWIAPPLRYARATGRRPLPSRCARRVTGSSPGATSTRARSQAPPNGSLDLSGGSERPMILCGLLLRSPS